MGQCQRLEVREPGYSPSSMAVTSRQRINPQIVVDRADTGRMAGRADDRPLLRPGAHPSAEYHRAVLHGHRDAIGGADGVAGQRGLDRLLDRAGSAVWNHDNEVVDDATDTRQIADGAF